MAWASVAGLPAATVEQLELDGAEEALDPRIVVRVTEPRTLRLTWRSSPPRHATRRRPPSARTPGAGCRLGTCFYDGRLLEHAPTPEARRVDHHVVYDVGTPRPLLPGGQ